MSSTTTEPDATTAEPVWHTLSVSGELQQEMEIMKIFRRRAAARAREG